MFISIKYSVITYDSLMTHKSIQPFDLVFIKLNHLNIILSSMFKLIQWFNHINYK